MLHEYWNALFTVPPPAMRTYVNAVTAAWSSLKPSLCLAAFQWSRLVRSVLLLTAHHSQRPSAALCCLISLLCIQEESSALMYSQYYAFNWFPPEEQRDRETEDGARSGCRNRRILKGRVEFHRTKGCYWIPVMILWIITSTIQSPRHI